MSKQSSACKSCGLRCKNGNCLPLDTPCKSVANSLCNPMKTAFEIGQATESPENRSWLEVNGLCPFCLGKPKVKKPGWFARNILRKGQSIVCPDCGAKLISVNRILTSEALHISEIEGEDSDTFEKSMNDVSDLMFSSMHSLDEHFYGVANKDGLNEK